MRKFKKRWVKKWTSYLAYSFSAFVSCLLAFMLALNFSIPAVSSSGELTAKESAEVASKEGGAKKTSSSLPPVSKIVKDIVKNLKLVVSQGLSPKKKNPSSIEDEVAAETFKPSAANPNEAASFPDSAEKAGGATAAPVSPPVSPSAPQMEETAFATNEGQAVPGHPPQQAPQGAPQGATQESGGDFVPVPENESGLASAPVKGLAEGVLPPPSNTSNDPSNLASEEKSGGVAPESERQLASDQASDQGAAAEGHAAFEGNDSGLASSPAGEMPTNPSMDPSMPQQAVGSEPHFAESGEVLSAEEANAPPSEAMAYTEEGVAVDPTTGEEYRNPASSSPNAAENIDSTGGGGVDVQESNRELSATSAEVRSYMAPFIYNKPGHQKDPFEDPTRRELASVDVGDEEEQVIIPQTPPEKYNLKDIILRGIIWHSRRPKALFELPGQEGGYYTLLKGDKIGQNGIIFDIRESEVVVVETHWTGSGDQATEEQTVKIKKINRITAK